jgi:hypothetical protein
MRALSEGTAGVAGVRPLLATPAVTQRGCWRQLLPRGCSRATTAAGLLILLSSWLLTTWHQDGVWHPGTIECGGTCGAMTGACHPHHYVPDVSGEDYEECMQCPGALGCPHCTPPCDGGPVEQAQCVQQGRGIWVSDDPNCTEPTPPVCEGSGDHSANDDEGTCDAAGHCMCTPTSWENFCWWAVFQISLGCTGGIAAAAKAAQGCCCGAASAATSSHRVEESSDGRRTE